MPSTQHPSRRWIALAWRLPTGGSTSRVATWRGLRKLGAVGLTPGAAILPDTEDLREQMEWIAQEIDECGGDAWILPVSDLAAADEAKIVARLRSERDAEYADLREAAVAFLRRAGEHPMPDGDYPARLRTEKELLALQRRFHKIRARDHADAPGRHAAAAMVDRCLAFRQGISRKLMPVTDRHPDT